MDGNIVEFTQAYTSDGERTRWRAVVKEDANGELRMVHGTWTGQTNGSFEATRSRDRSSAESRGVDVQQASLRSAEAGDADISKLQQKVSSLNHRLRQTEAKYAEDTHKLQAQLDLAEEQLAIEVSSLPTTFIQFW